MRKIIFSGIFSVFSIIAFSQAIIIDHNCTKLDDIPESAILNAKQTLHIAYEHTSHGSQLMTGMSALIGQTNLNGYKGNIYQWSDGVVAGSLDIDDNFANGGDLGHNGDTAWAPKTRNYLNNSSHSDVNVMVWSWCGGVQDNTTEGIQTYLDKMNELEQAYPNVKFVYMTGHSNVWNDATVKASNQQIRDYCIANNKILYDFYDIERYNPDGDFFEFVDDNCDYYNSAGGASAGNWATEWQNSHTEGEDWYDCSPAHTEALNGNLKAYAAWWLWCRLAGWDGTITNVKSITNNEIKIYPNPATNNLFLEIKNLELIINNYNKNEVFIYDVTGKVVKQLIVNNSKLIIKIDDLQNGVYFIQVGTITQKIIINK